MKFTSWPKPPIHKYNTDPPIPSEYALFGLKYSVVNGNPHLEIPSKPLNRENIENSVTESLKLFVKTLKTREGNILNEIRDLHVHINEEINKAKAFEKEEMFTLARNRKVGLKNKILSEIMEIIEK